MDTYAFKLYSQILRTFWRVFLILLGIAFVIIAFRFVKDILLMFIISGLISTLLSPVVNFLESKGLSRGLAILVVMLLIIALLAISLMLIIPGIIRTVESLSIKFQSGLFTDLSSKLEDFFAKNFHNAELARNVSGRLNDIGIKLLGGVGKFFKSAGSLLASIVIIPFMAFFLIKDGRKFKKALISSIPNKYFELTLNILYKAEHQVGKYIQGQALIALEVGTLSTIGLGIINLIFHGPVPYFFFVGMLAGLGNLIPFLGPYIGAIPALALAVLNNPTNLPMVLLGIVVTFFLVQMIDNTFFSPLIISKSVNVHPLTVVVIVLIGGKVAGAMGMLFAVPFWGVVKVVSSQVIWGLRNYTFRSPSKSQESLEAKT